MVQPTGNAGIPGIVPLKEPYTQEDYKKDNNNTDKKVETTACCNLRGNRNTALEEHARTNPNFPYWLFD